MSYFAWVGAYLVQCLVQWAMLFRRNKITKHFGMYMVRSNGTKHGISVEESVNPVRKEL